jgi:hypothetical protein
MAYTKDCRYVCDAPGCGKVATLEVFNAKNASMGKFCKADAHRVLIRTMKQEEPQHVDN